MYCNYFKTMPWHTCEKLDQFWQVYTSKFVDQKHFMRVSASYFRTTFDWNEMMLTMGKTFLVFFKLNRFKNTHWTWKWQGTPGSYCAFCRFTSSKLSESASINNMNAPTGVATLLCLHACFCNKVLYVTEHIFPPEHESQNKIPRRTALWLLSLRYVDVVDWLGR